MSRSVEQGHREEARESATKSAKDRGKEDAQRKGKPSERGKEPASREKGERGREPARPEPLNSREEWLVRDVGRFRSVEKEDLLKYQYEGRERKLRQDLARLEKQGLVKEHVVLEWPGRVPVTVIALTKKGAKVAARNLPKESEQKVYAGFKKRKEVFHDAAIYRMYQAEAAELEHKGVKIRRVVLDYELKEKLYSALAKVDASKHGEVAKEHGLEMADGKIALPDLRIEYDDAQGERAKVDLELATEHYHLRQLAQKAQAGFKMYASVDSAARLRRVWDEHDLMGEVFSF